MTEDESSALPPWDNVADRIADAFRDSDEVPVMDDRVNTVTRQLVDSFGNDPLDALLALVRRWLERDERDLAVLAMRLEFERQPGAHRCPECDGGCQHCAEAFVDETLGRYPSVETRDDDA